MVSFLHLVFYATAFTISSCFVLHYSLFLRQVSKWKKSNIPFLQPLFLVGHKYLLTLNKNSFVTALHRIYQENEDKELVAFFMGNLPVILVREPKLIQKLFVKNFDKTFCTYFKVPQDDVTTQSMSSFSSDRTQWTVARAAVAPMISTSRMGGPHFSIFKKQTERMWRYLEEARVAGQPIRVRNFARNFISDSVSRSIFGAETNSYEEEPKWCGMVQSFCATPFLSFFLLVRYPSLQKYGDKVFSSLRIVRQKYVDWMQAFLEDQIKYRLKNEVRQDDFIGYLMSLRDRSISNGQTDANVVSSATKTGASLRQMTGYTVTMLLGETEPALQVCLSAVHLLSLHPEHQDRIRREIEDAMKKHQVSELTFEVIQDLRFTEQCVYEALRLIPFVMFNMRRCSEDFQIPGTEYKFRKGDVFITAPYSMHRDPKYYKDPEKFDPGRFSSENRNSALLESYIGFGIGHRKCPGYKMGILQVVMFVASVLSKYEIRPRSHLEQMTATDFHHRRVNNLPKEELLIDLIPQHIFSS